MQKMPTTAAETDHENRWGFLVPEDSAKGLGFYAESSIKSLELSG